MDDKDLAAVITAFTAEDDSLAEVIRKAEQRRAKVRSILALLTTLNEAPPRFDGKLVDAIRLVLRENAHRSMSPTEVRDAVKAIGYEHPDEGNLLPAIHGVLKRLDESRDARTKTGKDGTTRYQWRGDSQRSAPTARPYVMDRLPNSGLYSGLSGIGINPQVQNALEQLATNPHLTEQMERLARLGESFEPLLKKAQETGDVLSQIRGKK